MLIVQDKPAFFQHTPGGNVVLDDMCIQRTDVHDFQEISECCAGDAAAPKFPAQPVACFLFIALLPADQMPCDPALVNNHADGDSLVIHDLFPMLHEWTAV